MALSDSGRELGELPPGKELTAAEAKAVVDAWSNTEGMQFPIHMLARALRAEIARLDGQVLTLQRANTAEVNARREVMANYDMAAGQVHALRQAIVNLYRELNTGKFAHMIIVAGGFSKQDVLDALLAMCKDPPNGNPG